MQSCKTQLLMLAPLLSLNRTGKTYNDRSNFLGQALFFFVAFFSRLGTPYVNINVCVSVFL